MSTSGVVDGATLAVLTWCRGTAMRNTPGGLFAEPDRVAVFCPRGAVCLWKPEQEPNRLFVDDPLSCPAFVHPSRSPLPTDSPESDLRRDPASDPHPCPCAGNAASVLSCFGCGPWNVTNHHRARTGATGCGGVCHGAIGGRHVREL